MFQTEGIRRIQLSTIHRSEWHPFDIKDNMDKWENLKKDMRNK
jgi:hypothetical protein